MIMRTGLGLSLYRVYVAHDTGAPFASLRLDLRYAGFSLIQNSGSASDLAAPPIRPSSPTALT